MGVPAYRSSTKLLLAWKLFFMVIQPALMEQVLPITVCRFAKKLLLATVHSNTQYSTVRSGGKAYLLYASSTVL